jgi:hypothetical protein
LWAESDISENRRKASWIREWEAAIQVRGFFTEMCQLKVLVLAKEQGTDGFKASRRWIMSFFTRNKLCIRRKTSVSQQLLDAYEEKILCF